MKREDFFYDLSQFMESKISDIKKSKDMTPDAWIKSVQNYVHSEYLRESYKKLYPDNTDERGVQYKIVWEELIKSNKQSAIEINNDIEEVLSPVNTVSGDKAIIYLMHEFARLYPEKFPQ